MALSLGTKGYNSLDIKAPSFKELGDIAKLTAPLLLTMISKVSNVVWQNDLMKAKLQYVAN